MILKLWIRFVGWLLHIANTDPGLDKESFYALKDRLRIRYGASTGHQLQHVRKDCWKCDGTGRYDPFSNEYCHDQARAGKHTETCRRCGGTGAFDEFWVMLESFRIGRYTFHRPVQRSYKKPEGTRVDIEGFIDHKRYSGHAPAEALFWLRILFDRPAAWRMMFGRFTCRRIRARYPGVMLMNFVAFMRCLWPSIRNKVMWSMWKRNRAKGVSQEIPF